MLSLNVQPAEKTDYQEDGSLDVVNIWRTIQGEGPFVGAPAIFIRLAGCDLQCPHCFGVGVKGRIPKLYPSVGPAVRLDKIKKGQTLLTFDENFQLVETKVQSVMLRDVRDWLEIVIGNKTYDVTPDHPFFTTRGLVSAHGLRLGDDVLEARTREIIAYKKSGDRNPMRNPEVALRSVLSKNYEDIANKISKTRTEKFRRGELTASFNMLSPEQQDEFRRNMSERHRREGNPNWKGKQSNLLDVKEAVENGQIKHCEKCGESGRRLLTHHIDGDHDNDARSNIAVWCHKCHNQHHQRGYNFWNGERRDGKKLIKDHNGRRVGKIREAHGLLPVMNLSCGPYPTYLADGMWVHNCDTDYTTNRERLGVNGIVSLVDSLSLRRAVRLVVITGGEPFRQNCGPLVWELQGQGYGVQFETNGTLWDENLFYRIGLATIVCSPKTPSIHPQLLPHVNAFKYILSADHVSARDGLPTQSLGMNGIPFRPISGYFVGDIFVQPLDEQDEEKNKRHLQAAIDSCMKFGYRLCYQVHKYIGLD